MVLNGHDITRLSTVGRIRLGLALGQQIVRPLRSLTLTDNVALAAGHVRLASPWKATFQRDRSTERARARVLLGRDGVVVVSSTR